MPPHLHPRSALTTSLFTTTLAVSFLVVGMPHILPCPVDSRQYAEGSMEGLEGQKKRKRRRRPEVIPPAGEEDGTCSGQGETTSGRRARECPIPKPGGLIGQIMGFQNHARERPAVKVESVRSRKPGEERSSGEIT